MTASPTQCPEAFHERLDKLQEDFPSVTILVITLKTPWGIKNINSTVKPLPPETNNRQTTWQMQLGELNQIEVVFWLPNMLSIGALIIIILVWCGYYLKYSSLS